VAWRRADDAELELPFRDLSDDGLRIRDGQPHAHVGMRLVELAEQDGNDGAAGPGRGAELERPGERTRFAAADLVEQLLLEGKQLLRGRVEPQPGLRRLDTAAGPVEGLGPEPLLERADLKADGRLGDPEPLRRLREALPLDHGAECGKLTRVHERPGD